MKFAFSTDGLPPWDFPTIAGKAREFGYDGVEINGTSIGQSDFAGTLTLNDPARNLEVLGAFASAGIEIACVAAPVRLTGDRQADRLNAEALRGWVDLAAELVCRQVMLRDPEPRRGMSGLAAGAALGEWLAPVADHALTRGITLLVCNDSTLNTARLMWTMLERLRHPAVACCWDIENAGKSGESPAVSVPTLNSQIRYARVGAIALANGGRTHCETEDRRGPSEARLSNRGVENASLRDRGETKTRRLSRIEPPAGCNASAQLFLTRLRGIGYEGYVTAALNALLG